MNEQFTSWFWGGRPGFFRCIWPINADNVEAVNLHGTYEQQLPTLQAYNDMGYGVFFIPNEGGKSDDAINRFNAFFLDIDGDKGQVLPTLWHVEPTIILKRENNYHVYWLLNPTNDHDKWRNIEERLVSFYNADKAVKNASRVLRLPGFKHTKVGSSGEPYIIYATYKNRYNVDELSRGLPEIPQQDARPAQQSDSFFNSLDYGNQCLAHIDPNCEYNEWVNVIAGFTHQFGTSQEVVDILDAWSSRSDEKYAGKGEVLKKINSFKRDGFGSSVVTFATVVDMAKKGGFNPIANMMGHRAKNIFVQLVDQPLVNIEPLSELDINQDGCMMNDHLEDAINMHKHAYRDRLALLDSETHYWNGCKWEYVNDSMLRRHTALAMRSSDGESKVTNSRITGTIQLIKDIATNLGDSNPPTLNIFFQNGVLNVNNGELKPHDLSLKNTSILNCEYQPGEQPTQWLDWLSSIFGDEPERITLLQEIMGWMLTRETLGIEKAALFIGPTRAGKGTVAKLMNYVMGETSGSFNLGDLADGKTLTTIRGKNVVIDPDFTGMDRQSAKQVVGTFKQITSNDKVSFKQIYVKETQEVVMNVKLLVISNNIPKMFDDSGATAKRWVPLVFNKSFYDKEDIHLLDRLKTEASYIISWAIEGLKRLTVNHRFTLPQSSIDELETINLSTNSLHDFVGECLNVGNEDTHRSSDKEVYDSYRRWCLARGDEPFRRPQLRDGLIDMLRGDGVTFKSSVRVDGHDNPIRGFKGISLKPDAILPESSVVPFGKKG